MLNNANNYSENFNYEKIHFSSNIFFRLLFWYLATIIFTLVYNMIVFDSKRALSYFFNSLISDGLLLVIVILRASRFKIFYRKYFNENIELPFYITKNGDEDFKLLYLLPIKIRGESSYEYKLTTFLNKIVQLFPLTENKSNLKEPLTVNLCDKILLNDDVIVYKAQHDTQTYYIKPKTRGETETDQEHPIAGLYTLKQVNNQENEAIISYNDLHFIDWIYVK